MVGRRAAKVAILVGGSALLVLLTGAVLLFVVRILRFAILALLVVLLAYATYELYSGWTAAGTEETTGETVTAADETDEPLESIRSEYVSGSLSDEEFEAELEEVLDDDRESELEYESR